MKYNNIQPATAIVADLVLVQALIMLLSIPMLALSASHFPGLRKLDHREDISLILFPFSSLSDFLRQS